MYGRSYAIGELASGFTWYDATILCVVGIPIMLIALIWMESKHHE